MPARPPAAHLRHDLLDDWELWLRAADSSDNTVNTRVTGVKLLWHTAGTPDPVSIPTIAVVRWLANCNTKWTRCTYAASARAWFKWLNDRGYRNDNPMVELPVPRAPRSVPRPAATETVRSVLEVCGLRARAYMTLATFLGLRVHEIAKIRGEDFDDEGWYYVRGKGDVVAAIPTHPLVEELRKGYPRSGYWFPGKDAGHVQPSTVTSVIGRAFRRAGYPVTAHQLRHWYGTHVQRVGKDARATQTLLRHANLASSQIYTLVADRHLQEIVRRLAV